MNLNEVKKHVTFQLIIYILIGICFLLSIFAILTTPVSAAELVSNDITIGIANVSTCGVKSNGYYCTGQGSATFTKVAINTNHPYAVNWIGLDLNNTIPYFSNVPSTIEIYSPSNSFTNSTYSCSWGGNNQPLSCSVSRVSSGRLNINYRSAASGGSPQYLYINIGNDNVTTWLNGIRINKVVSLQTVQDPNASVIENQNQNTSDIINNNNQNTQEVTNKITETFNQMVTNGLQENNNERRTLSNMCKNIYYTEIGMGKTINGGGNLQDLAGAFYMTDYVAINIINDSSLGGNANRLYIQEPNSSTAGYYFAFYDNNKTLISVERTGTRSLTIPSNAVWFRFGSTSANTTVSRYSNQCIEASDKVYGYLNDDTNPTVDQNAITDTFNSVQTNNPLAYLLTLPTDLLTAILNGLSSNTCQDFEIGKFGHVGRHDLGTYTFKFPCINIQDKLGSNLYNTIDLFVSIGILVITIVKLYNTISSYLTLGAEDEAKSHSHFLTPMDFLGNILGGNISGVGNSINNGGNL